MDLPWATNKGKNPLKMLLRLSRPCWTCFYSTVAEPNSNVTPQPAQNWHTFQVISLHISQQDREIAKGWTERKESEMVREGGKHEGLKYYTAQEVEYVDEHRYVVYQSSQAGLETYLLVLLKQERHVSCCYWNKSDNTTAAIDTKAVNPQVYRHTNWCYWIKSDKSAAAIETKATIQLLLLIPKQSSKFRDIPNSAIETKATIQLLLLIRYSMYVHVNCCNWYNINMPTAAIDIISTCQLLRLVQ